MYCLLLSGRRCPVVLGAKCKPELESDWPSSSQYFEHPVLLGCSPQFQGDASATAHRFAPGRITVGMADAEVYIGAAADSGGNVVDRVIHVLVDTGLETEWSDDSGVVMFLAGGDELLSQLKCLL